MIKMYCTDMNTNQTSEVSTITRGTWINMVAPTEEEIASVCEQLQIKEDFIRYPLDYEEKARIDVEEEDNTTLFIVDVPILERTNNTEMYTTMPLGMIVVRDDYFITVSLAHNRVVEHFEKNKMKNFATFKKTRFILQILYQNASLFLNLLKQINKETEIAESTLKNSMKNKELLKLLTLEKSLVYFTTSLRSNELVMEKTMRGRIIKLYDEDEDILEDAIIENKQAIEMSKIYSDILNGTMDAYASIISNNLNGVMKFLTAITIVISIPTLIASFWGMNVPVPMQQSPYGFGIILYVSLIISIVALNWLNKKGMMR